MKTLDEGLREHLASGATTLCWCWKLIRRDDVVLGFTDHDRDLVIDGICYEAAGGFSASALESGSGLAVDNLDMEGALSSARLQESDIAAGLYDDAEVEIWRVNWQTLSQRVLMRKGNLGEVTRTGARFTAELRGLAHRLNQPVGRLFQYGCDADFSDARCGLHAGAWQATGEVLEVFGSAQFMTSGLDAFAEGFFSRGRLRFTEGANEGAMMEVKAHRKADGGVEIEVWRGMAREVKAGDRFIILAGCDKQFETCRHKFSNGANFRGFPHMPGNDFIVAGATSGKGRA